MKSPIQYTMLALALLSTLNLQPSTAFAQGTAFTYQGRLNTGTNGVKGKYDLIFQLFNASTGGSQVGSTITDAGVGITNGLFTATLDFDNAFEGAAYWLQINVRTNGAASYSALSPRQPVTPAPYAIMANSASNLLGTVPAANIAGAIGVASGGTGAATAADARADLGAAASGANADITSLSALTTLSSGTINLSGNLYLPATTASSGIIYIGGIPVLDAFQPVGTPPCCPEWNSFVGPNAGNLTMNGVFNTGDGYDTLASNTSGSDNTAVGGNALFSNQDGYDNTANGYGALFANSSGFYNTASGSGALESNMGGTYNTAGGWQALYSNTNGSYNTANGDQALFSNVNGNYNTADGVYALYFNLSGSYNTAIGYQALNANTSGRYNTANGEGALYSNTNGSYNTADGVYALGNNLSGSYNTAIGYQSLTSYLTSSNNIALGYRAGQYITGSSNIDIGNQGTSSDINIIRIGNGQTATYLAGTVYATGNPGFSGSSSTTCGNGVYGVINSDCGAGVVGQANSGAAHGLIARYGTSGNYCCYLGNANSAADLYGNVYVTGNVGIGTGSPDALLTVNGTADKPGGGSWSTFSDGRLKDIGAEFTHGLAALEDIQPVHYHYKADNPLNLPSQPEYVGVVAQQVQNAVPEAVQRNKDGYLVVNNDPIIWTMVNAIKELNQKRETEAREKDAEIQDLKQSVAELKALVEKLANK